MNNKAKIEKKLKKYNCSLGCYDNAIENLNYQNLKKVLDSIPHGATDVKVFICRKPYIVEIFDVNIDKDRCEYDFNILSLGKYREIYGEEYF